MHAWCDLQHALDEVTRNRRRTIGTDYLSTVSNRQGTEAAYAFEVVDMQDRTRAGNVRSAYYSMGVAYGKKSWV